MRRAGVRPSVSLWSVCPVDRYPRRLSAAAASILHCDPRYDDRQRLVSLIYLIDVSHVDGRVVSSLDQRPAAVVEEICCSGR